MKNIEEYLYYHESPDYGFFKFVSCTYVRAKKRLTVRYIYAEEITPQLPVLKKRLEEFFMQQVGLPIKYEFFYNKVYLDNLVLQLEIANFLRRKFSALTGKIKDDDVRVELEQNIWKVNLYLSKQAIEFLQNSNQWQKFQRDLAAKNFYEFIFSYNLR